MIPNRMRILVVDNGSEPDGPQRGLFVEQGCQIVGHVKIIAEAMDEIRRCAADYVLLQAETVRCLLLELHQAQRSVEQARLDLEERKVIDRAKGLLMSRNKLTESDAYRAMQKLAMDRKIKIAHVARNILDAAELFDMRA